MKFKLFLKSKSGATAIEYSLIGAIIALVIIVAFGMISSPLKTQMKTISDTLKNEP